MIPGLFVREREHPLRSVRRFVLIAFAGSIAAFQVCGSLGVRFNLSPSLPMRVYVGPKDGTLVEFCVTEPFASMAIERGHRDQVAVLMALYPC